MVPHGDSDFSTNQIIDRTEARKQLNLPMDQKLVLFFGQIKKVKGLDVLLRAWAIVSDQRKMQNCWWSEDPGKLTRICSTRLWRRKSWRQVYPQLFLRA
jgi:hypothetical protein